MQHKIIITGANGQLGRAVTKYFIEKDWYVVAIASPRFDPDSDALDAAEVHPCDLTDEDAVATLLTDIFSRNPDVQSAALLTGGFDMGTIDTTGLGQLERMYSLNFKTAYNSARCVLRHLEDARGGNLIFIGARPALDPHAGKEMTAYALSKSLVFELARLINASGEMKNIKASVIVPGIIDTPANRKAMPEASFEEWVKPQDIAKSIDFILSEEGSSLRETVLKMY